MPSSPRKVLVLVDTSTTWSTEVIRGVNEYTRDHMRWLLFIEPRGELETMRVPRSWRGDGIIARITQRPLARELLRRAVPVVNVSWSVVPGYSFPQVVPDETGIGKLAAHHFLERGFRHFAYCGLPKQPNYTDRCGPAFSQELLRHGHDCHAFRPPRPMRQAHAAVTIPNVQQWLRRLPKPVGVLAWNPERGRNVTDACWASGIRVPDEVAVVSTADDDLLCAISYPPLSSVDECPRRVGFEAAVLLDQLMSGKAPPRRPVLIAPQRVVARHSTEVLAIEDREVVQALRFIREHFVEPLGVGQILAAVPLSRRILEQRFRRALGRSPAAEIRRVRLARATELLLQTNWPMPRIAQASGFAHVEGMNRVFRRELQQTPTGYRRQVRG